MILFPLLLFLGSVCMALAIRYLGQSVASYYDFVALMMVVGGTLSVGIVLLPWEYRSDLRAAARFLFRPEKRRYRDVMKEVLTVLREGQLLPPSGAPFLYQKILREGLEMIQLGFSRNDLEGILSERVFHSVKRWKKVAAAVRNLAKYPPAFGLMGTVFGLVNVMKHMQGATDASKLGVEMAVALIATMYGLLIANFVVNPLGEILAKKAEEEEEYANIAMEAVLLVKDGRPLLESVELLNSFIPDDQRYSLNTSAYDEPEVAA